jgi:hypothetical protein
VDIFCPRVEVKLRNSIMEWRLPHITRWNTKCSEMLREALELLEKARSSDSTLTETVQVLETMTDYKVTMVVLRACSFC